MPVRVEELLAQVAEAVRTLNRLAATLEAALARPPVRLQVERLEVQTLAFHLGDIDVQELQGELNIGITQSLRLQPAGRGAAVQPEPAVPSRPARPADPGDHAMAGQREDGRAAGPEAPGRDAAGGRPPGGTAQGGKAPPGTLRNSVVSRRLAQVKPGPAYTPGNPGGGAGNHGQGEVGPGPGPTTGEPPRVQIWPPPKLEGSASDDQVQS